MNIFIKLLAAFGFGGQSLDGILRALTKIDAALEKFEADKAAEAARERQAAVNANARAEDLEAIKARASRVRGKVGELIA